MTALQGQAIEAPGRLIGDLGDSNALALTATSATNPAITDELRLRIFVIVTVVTSIAAGLAVAAVLALRSV